MLQSFVAPVIILVASLWTASNCVFTFCRGIIPDCVTVIEKRSNKRYIHFFKSISVYFEFEWS